MGDDLFRLSPIIPQEKSLELAKIYSIDSLSVVGSLLCMLEEVLRNSKDHCITGEDAFRLYDTYGFPLELTQEIAGENDIEVDVEGFKKATKAHGGSYQCFRGG